MGKQQKTLLFVLICSFMVMFGCSKAAISKDESASNQTLRETEEKVGEKQKEKMEEVELEPIAINVIDPTTKKVIKRILPEEMGYGKDNEQYKINLENWAKELARGTDTSPGYDQRNTLDKIAANGQITKGQPRVILEETELVESIMQASEKGGDVELPLYITASGYQPEDVPRLNEVVVASYTTYFNPTVTGRNKNIELSAQAIDDVIVGVNDHFSFNTTVGPSDEAHGYQPAQEAINGKLVMGIGGGICQTSSTLFNAVDQLGVDYIEWHHHSVAVGYVPTGRDATVSYGGKDFRFVNTIGAPFLIKTIYGNDRLTIEIRTSKEYEEVLKKAI